LGAEQRTAPNSGYQEMAWKERLNAGQAALAKYDYPNAEYQLWEALKEAEVFGGESDQMIETAETLARCLMDMNKYEDAEPLMLGLADIQQRKFGGNNIRTATTLVLLAEMYYAKGEYAKAEPFAQSSLKIYEMSHGPQHDETVRLLSYMAYIFHAQQKFAQAEPFYEKAMSASIKTMNENPKAALQIINGYAALLSSTHREEQANNLLAYAQQAQAQQPV
jgi:tetratricopeptide (TPR) repeat protein